MVCCHFSSKDYSRTAKLSLVFEEGKARCRLPPRGRQLWSHKRPIVLVATRKDEQRVIAARFRSLRRIPPNKLLYPQRSSVDPWRVERLSSYCFWKFTNIYFRTISKRIIQQNTKRQKGNSCIEKKRRNRQIGIWKNNNSSVQCNERGSCTIIEVLFLLIGND